MAQLRPDCLAGAGAGLLVQRHAACRAVNAKLKYEGGAYKEYVELCKDKDAFVATIERCLADPRGKEAREVCWCRILIRTPSNTSISTSNMRLYHGCL